MFYGNCMRTTIEMKTEHRAKLLEIAANRGQKGFSSVVSEAIDVYLGLEAQMEKQRQRVLDLEGALSQKEAKDLRKQVERIRDTWR
jgi:hypothetical protein